MKKGLTRELMTPKQIECFDLICDVVGGEHHIRGTSARIEDATSHGIRVGGLLQNFSTTDRDLLTRLVVLGHDRCIRVEVASSSRGYTAFMLHKRARFGRNYEVCPGLEEAAADIRKKFPQPAEVGHE
ncbi:MAG TPA: hypothetical protein DC063_03800 [Arenimonas sp.]|nr:hypothetical protein [Arenimonas sp.]